MGSVFLYRQHKQMLADNFANGTKSFYCCFDLCCFARVRCYGVDSHLELLFHHRQRQQLPYSTPRTVGVNMFRMSACETFVRPLNSLKQMRLFYCCTTTKAGEEIGASIYLGWSDLPQHLDNISCALLGWWEKLAKHHLKLSRTLCWIRFVIFVTVAWLRFW